MFGKDKNNRERTKGSRHSPYPRSPTPNNNQAGIHSTLFSSAQNPIPNAAEGTIGGSGTSTPARPSGLGLGLSAPPTTQRKIWSGLEALAHVVGRNANELGPIKSVVDAITKLKDVLEERVQSSASFDQMESELNELCGDLARYIDGPMPSTMTPSITSLAAGIQQQLEFLFENQQRSELSQTKSAKDDIEKIAECYRRVQSLLNRLIMNANLSIWKITDEQAVIARLTRLPNSPDARYRSARPNGQRREGCTSGTRVDIMKQMQDWAHNPKSEAIYWLNGMAGTGKTTIAASICEHLEITRRLAASFFCSKQLPACRDVNRIIPSIAYQLSQYSQPFRAALFRALEQDWDAYNHSLAEQFDKLVVNPLQEAKDSLPEDLAIVIDALDECDNIEGTTHILLVLLSYANSLPLKYFVTSRPDSRIVERMKHNEELRLELRLHELDHLVVSQDVRTYLARKLESKKPSSADLDALTKQSGVLFIYAATVVRYLEDRNFSRYNARLAQLLGASTSLSSNSYRAVDELYTQILKTALNDPTLDDNERQEMKLVLDSVICAQEPMTLDLIAGLLGLHDSDSVIAALDPLMSVLHVLEPNGPVITLHESFPNYILDKNRSGDFWCDGRYQHAQLTQRCFDIITKQRPAFNICGLKSSYIVDDEIPDLEERVEKAIPSKLFYACRHWATHIELAETSKQLGDLLYVFLSEKLLLWLEILNLKKSVHLGSRALYKAQALCETQIYLNPFKELAYDAWRFATMLSSSVLAQSTPHIYVSGLVFWPADRPISSLYLQQMSGLIQVTGTAINKRTVTSLAVCVTGSEAQRVKYSPDGINIACAFRGGTVRFWEARTGHPTGNSIYVGSGVCSIAYSRPDGAKIAFGLCKGDISIWDVSTGEPVKHSILSQEDSVNYLAYSLNGAHLMSGSADMRTSGFSLWDTQSCQLIWKGIDLKLPISWPSCGPYTITWVGENCPDTRDGFLLLEINFASACSQDGCHSISIFSMGEDFMQNNRPKTRTIKPRSGGLTLCGAYSPDGTYLIEGFSDGTAEVCDPHTGSPLCQPLQGHVGMVSCVVCSPDSKHAATGSEDGTLRIWNIQSLCSAKTQTSGNFNERVQSMAYSRNGLYLALGLENGSVQIWDTRANCMIGQQQKGHDLRVGSITFSPDSTYIFTGSEDKTIRAWNAIDGSTPEIPLITHSCSVQSVAHSPTSAHILSVSSSFIFVRQSLHIWDTHTGEMIKQLGKGTEMVGAAVYSADGEHVAVLEVNCIVRIWNVETNTLRASVGVGDVSPYDGRINGSLAYLSQVGSDLVIGYQSGAVRIWNVHTGQVGREIQAGSYTDPKVACFSNSCLVIVGAGDKLHIWDPHSGTRMLSKGYGGFFTSVACSPDNKHFASLNNGGMVYIWDICQFSDPMSDVQEAEVERSQSDEAVHEDEVEVEELTSNLLEDWELRNDGWVVTRDGRLLTWVPDELRVSLIRRPYTAIISRFGWMKLDFANAYIGEEWEKSYVPL